MKPLDDAYDLDTEIAKYGGHMSAGRSARGTARDPLAALRQSDPSSCAQVEAFAKVLGASVDMLVSRGAPDPGMVGCMSYPRWERRRLDQIFRAGRITPAEARAHEEEKKAERVAWLEEWRTIQDRWAKWLYWRRQFPQEADDYRRQRQDADGGDRAWLLELLRVSRTRRATRSRKDKSEGVDL